MTQAGTQRVPSEHRDGPSKDVSLKITLRLIDREHTIIGLGRLSCICPLSPQSAPPPIGYHLVTRTMVHTESCKLSGLFPPPLQLVIKSRLIVLPYISNQFSTLIPTTAALVAASIISQLDNCHKRISGLSIN